eukprot:jgi/Chrzof1/6482/Cz18g12200.t1
MLAPQVTAPQLSLLEAALAGMDRVDAFIMMRAHRSPGNVFEEAERAWNKRQAAILDKIQQQQQQQAAAGAGWSTNRGFGFQGFADLFKQHVEYRGKREGGEAMGGGAGGNVQDPEGRKIAHLAASAARAARLWRMYNSSKAPNKVIAG